MLMKTISGKQALALRSSLGVSQRNFWKRLGISQSGGSRYECGRAIPRTVYLLMELAYSDDPTETFKQIRYRGRSR